MANNKTYPIVYVRGFAMSRTEIDETTADPFCGFNVGSTVYRATPDRKQPPRKFFFQSPVVRLARDFGYNDVYLDGEDLADLADKPQGVKAASIVIYRYYDSASTLFGDGKTPPMKDFGSGLSELIWRVRKLICANAENALKEEEFRCYLVAHSMGGLVCRTFLQNPHCDPRNVRPCVDKFFTYATPHNGIDMAGVNVPEWLTLDRISNFNRETMAGYLELDGFDKNDKTKDRVDLMPDAAFPIDRVFCLVGTNRSDYQVAEGLSRTFVGHGSDGLVHIENAVVCGAKPGRESVRVSIALRLLRHRQQRGRLSEPDALSVRRRAHRDLAGARLADAAAGRAGGSGQGTAGGRSLSIRIARVASRKAVVPDPAHCGRRLGRVRAIRGLDGQAGGTAAVVSVDRLPVERGPRQQRPRVNRL